MEKRAVWAVYSAITAVLGVTHGSLAIADSIPGPVHLFRYGIYVPDMAKNTSRDRIWEFALENCVRERRPVTIDTVADECDVSKKTARDALNSMKFLEKEYIPDGRARWVLKREEYFEPYEDAIGLT